VGAMLTELEALWRGRISRMDELFAEQRQQQDQQQTPHDPPHTNG
jgi:hypothetical protein